MEIKELKIFSSNIDEQEDFYKNVLGFKCARISESILEIQAGKTKLILEKSEKEFFYHFAFLIPTGALDSAIGFLESKSIQLLPLKDSKIIYFKSARAIYFYDKDGNIAEFIERPTLNYPTDKDFSIDKIIKINEIGLPVETSITMAETLTNQHGIQSYEGAPISERFCWVGDYNGAFIVIQKGRNWLPTQKPGIINDFSIKYEDQGKHYSISFENNQIKPQ